MCEYYTDRKRLLAVARRVAARTDPSVFGLLAIALAITHVNLWALCDIVNHAFAGFHPEVVLTFKSTLLGSTRWVLSESGESQQNQTEPVEA